MSRNETALNSPSVDFLKKASALGHNGEDLDPISKVLPGDRTGKFQKSAAKYYAQGMKKVGNLEKDLEKTISANPLTSLLIAAGIGLVAGAFLNRR